MTEICLLARIQGRVQGVSFRYHTRMKARSLGLRGWVKNLPDGSVETSIYGKPEQVRAMQEWLKQGPPDADVKHIDFMQSEATQAWSDFNIRY